MAYLEYFKSILMKLNADYTLSESLQGRYFYEKLKLLIKLKIDENNQKLLA